LSVEALKAKNIPIEGIVFVGDENSATEKIILHKTNVRMIARIPLTETVTSDFIKDQASKINL
jgi:dethiobiotin synthetase